MTRALPEFVVVSLRDQPTELHLSDGSVAFLEPRGTRSLAAAVRDSPQLLELERQRAVRVKPAPNAARPPPDASDDDALPRPRSRSKRTRTE
ncbi:hypothetical protein ACIHQR_10605 [Corallococcus coralloides]|uniref:hypothetical protein n=1 Tax=Corallococcus coralloides TaxID=184914 RepID=UPI00384A6F86